MRLLIVLLLLFPLSGFGDDKKPERKLHELVAGNAPKLPATVEEWQTEIRKLVADYIVELQTLDSFGEDFNYTDLKKAMERVIASLKANKGKIVLSDPTLTKEEQMKQLLALAKMVDYARGCVEVRAEKKIAEDRTRIELELRDAAAIPIPSAAPTEESYKRSAPPNVKDAISNILAQEKGDSTLNLTPPPELPINPKFAPKK